MKKRLLAGLLSLSLLTGLLPVPAFAADSLSQPLNNDDSQMEVEQSTVTVDYGAADRSTATITYHKNGIEADPFNLVFLVDMSRQGAQSYTVFEQMMNDNGMSYIYDYKAASTVQLITYQNTASSTGIVNNKDSFMAEFGKHGVSGEGTANEPVALKTAIEAVQAAHTANNYPTVVFWVLGEQFGTTDTNAIEQQLKLMDTALTDGTDALITWQYAAQPNELLTQYATQHIDAHDDSGQKYPAAHAANDAVLMQEEMAADLEEIVHDHYHNISFSLLLDDNQTLVKSIKDAWYEAGSTMAGLTVTPRADGKGLDVTIERLCRQIAVDFIIEVELDTSIYEKQTVIPAGKIVADHNGDNGGLHTGLFDEQIEYGLELGLPAVELDRTAHDITFLNVDGVVSDIINKLTGETITLPMGDGLMQDGSSFGGWNVVSGVNMGYHYAPGEIISMPGGDMTLEPAFGHVEVELEIDYTQGEAPVYKNQMEQFKFVGAYSNPLSFYNVSLPDGTKITNTDIISIQVIDFLPQYDQLNDPNDARHVQLTNVDDAVYARHVGATGEDKVVAYLAPNQSQPGKYDMYIAGPGGVKAPMDCSKLFSRETMSLSGLTSISLDALDTTGVTNMSNMFSNNYELESLTFGEKFDTSSVTNMYNMFSGCNVLTDLDVSRFDTSRVINMYGMFNGCQVLTSLDLSNWDTSAVTDISWMFTDCYALKNLTFGTGWDTSNVTDMSEMFRYCPLDELDLSGWDTRNVTDMSNMFWGCGVTTLTFGGKWDTSSVTNMPHMFYGCSKVANLDLSSWDTSQVTDMSQMFSNAENLQQLNVNGWDVSNVKNMEFMFHWCLKLESLDLSSWVISNATTNMQWMFNNCPKLHTLTFGDNCDTSGVTNMTNMFNGCNALKNLTFGAGWNTSSVTSMAGMFNDCKSLTELDLSGWDTSSVTNMGSMFYCCTGLTKLDLSSTVGHHRCKRRGICICSSRDGKRIRYHHI